MTLLPSAEADSESLPILPKPRLGQRWAIALALVLAVSGCAEQRIRRTAQDALNAGAYEQSVQLLKDGSREHPDSVSLQSALVLTRTQAVNRLLESATTLMNQGKPLEAGAQLDRALILEPQNTRVLELKALLDIQQTQNAALEQARGLVASHNTEAALKLIGESLKDNPRHAGLLDLQRHLMSQLRRRQTQEALKGQLALAETRPISLDFRDANLRTVLDLVSRDSGINFIIDKDVRPDTRITVFMKQARVEDALDLIIGTNQLAKKVIDPRTIVIYPNTPDKQREYEEQIVRVFHLSNAEAKGAAVFLKSMLRIRDPFVDERTNMLSLRESPETIELAERLIKLYDTNEPEVLLDVEVLEVNANKTLQAGVSLPSSVGFSIGRNSDAGPTPANLTLATVRHLTRNDIAITVGGASVTLNRQLGDFTTLANPRIRTKNKEKAKIMVGEKIPVISATTGQAGFVSDTVTYLDVGLKLDVEPTVYADDDVSIKLGLEVSNLGSAVQTSSGTMAYQISTRNATTVLRLHDGESQLLAGLISKNESHGSTGIPGLDSLPLLGRLFSNQTDTDNRTELVLVITPHIVRNISPEDASQTELWVGTEAHPHVRPLRSIEESTNAVPVNPGSAGAAPDRITLPMPVAAAAPAMTLHWHAPAAVKVGDSVELALDQDTQAELRGMTLEVGFDHSRLQLLDSEEGGFFRQGGAATSFTRGGDATGSTVRLGILRSQASAASGKGRLLKLRFKALSSGPADVRLLAIQPIGLNSTPSVPAVLPSVTLQIN
jgi:general secretion pathway protein D